MRVASDLTDPAVQPRSAAYRFWTLAVLTTANVLNYADRGLLGPLAEPLQRDLGISHADLGFLVGTSFVLFNALVGVAVGRVADGWRRNWLLMIGVGLWSLMTAVSAFADGYGQLVAARIGVGIGEAAIGAVGYSMLADVFPARQRGLAFAVFLFGPFLGLSLAMGLGGWIVDGWPEKCGAFGLCGLDDWRAAFLLFGAPGLLVALLCLTLGEPRGKVAEPGRASPLADGLFELSVMTPPFSLVQVWRLRGARAGLLNIGVAAAIAAAAAGLISLTGSTAQWCAVGLGVYGLFSWCQAQVARDPALFRLTVGSPAFLLAILGAALLASTNGAVSFWSIPLVTKEMGVSPAEAGRWLGVSIGVGAILGTLSGGFLADLWKRSNRSAALLMGMIIAVLSIGGLTVALTTSDPRVVIGAFAFMMFVLAGWPAGITSLLQDLVTPAMRARTAALYVAGSSLIAGSIGPYGVGRLADALGSIRLGLGYLFFLLPLALLVFFVALRKLPSAYARKSEAGPDEP